MWKGLTPEMDLALRAKIVRPAILFSLDHPLGWVRLWSGLGNITWNGDVYHGAMAMLDCTPEEQTTELQVARMTFRLKASDFSDEIMQMITVPIRRRPLYSWKALLDENANVIPQPRLRFDGYADQPRIVDEPDESGAIIMRHVELSVEGAFSNLTTPLRTLISHEEQIAKYPDDDGLSLMSSIGEQNIVWDVGPYNNFSPI